MSQVELYKFVRGTSTWTKTSSASSVSYGGDTYSPAVMGRGDIESKGEISKAKLEISLDLFDDLAQEMLGALLFEPLTLTVYTQDEIETAVAWKGRLAEVKPSLTKMSLSFESIFSSLKRPGLRAVYQKPCRHSIYSPGCGVDKSSFATVGEMTAVDGTSITIAEAALEDDGYYTGGVIEASDGQMGFITVHAGSSLTLLRVVSSLTSGEDATIYPGCDELRGTCLNKFDNLDNFGGFPWIPDDNPMDGTSIA
jgi:uncharacterized phage protein (TIGR02218 family)